VSHELFLELVLFPPLFVSSLLMVNWEHFSFNALDRYVKIDHDNKETISTTGEGDAI